METVAAAIPAQAYDGLGWFYDRYWPGFCQKLMPALDRLVLGSLPRGASVLDLCCGTGHLAAAMTRRGLRVTGVDLSLDMVRYARRNAPRAAFVAADARDFAFTCRFDAVISTGDSLNHLLSARDLKAVFERVLCALRPGGALVFDLNMAAAFTRLWHKSSTVVDSDHLMYVRGRFDKGERIGLTEVTVFRKAGAWMRRDLRMVQRCYTRGEVKTLLREAGFTAVSAHNAGSLGVRGQRGVGRAFFRAVKPDH